MHDKLKNRKSEDIHSSDDNESDFKDDVETIHEYNSISRDCAYVKHINNCSDLC